MPESLSIDPDEAERDDAYPVAVTLRHLARPGATAPSLDTNGATPVPNGLFRSNLNADTTDSVLHQAQENPESFTEEVRAKYMVGCDGAHSWTRRQIGSVMEGEQTDYIWFTSPPLYYLPLMANVGQ